MREIDLNDFSAFLQEFQKETERGAALVGAAMIDDRLAETLRAFMVTNKATSTLLDGGSAPLGTFSSRIDAAFALALIDRHEYSESHLIRKIRNEFAHRKHGTTFYDSKIAALCYRFKSDLPGGREKFEGNPRGIFVNAVTLISLGLTYRAKLVSKDKRVARDWF